MNDEFYIGWESKAAPGLRKAVSRIVISLFCVVVTIPILLAISQHLIGASVFEWGTKKSFTGILRAQPYPYLLVARPGNVGDVSKFSTYYLVAPWKFGLPSTALGPFDGKSVKLQGTLIYRGNQTMIETKPEWITVSSNALPAAEPSVVSLGRQTFTGEIVDSKCFLGVMNPGQLTPHRSCAIRCISGGCPPVLLVRQKVGPAIYLLLVSPDGGAINQRVLDFVAEPVEITGDVERRGDLLILRADPATYRRVKSLSEK